MRRRVAFLFAFSMLGCSSSSENDNPSPAGGTGGTSGSGGSGGSAGTASGGAAGAAGASGASGAGGSCVNNALVINEISTSSPDGSEDEFLELYNASESDLGLDGYSITYSTASATSTSTLWIAEPADAIPSKDFFVIGGLGFTGNADAGFEQMSQLDESAGVRLFQVSRALDQVAWGNVLASHPYIDVSPAQNVTASGSSMGRVPDGQDCDDNGTDFDTDLARSPGSAN